MQTYKIELQLELNEESNLEWLFESIRQLLEDGESISKARYMLEESDSTQGA